MKKYLIALAAMTYAGFVAAQASNSVDHAFSACVFNEAKAGNYSSFDGGISAAKILDRCDASYNKWIDSCRLQSSTKDCVSKAAVSAQVALKMNGK